jgi:hypothetical protein
MQNNYTYHPEELMELHIYDGIEVRHDSHTKSLEELREMPDSPTILLYLLLFAMLAIHGLFENRH